VEYESIIQKVIFFLSDKKDKGNRIIDAYIKSISTLTSRLMTVPAEVLPFAIQSLGKGDKNAICKARGRYKKKSFALSGLKSLSIVLFASR
jgi:hypothetical protein